jgi:hypothetical protein
MGERRVALEELRMLFTRARAPFVINMWEGEAKVLHCRITGLDFNAARLLHAT